MLGTASPGGQEARSDTGEAVLPEQALPQCQQAFTFGIVVEQAVPTAAEKVAAPPGYDQEPRPPARAPRRRCGAAMCRC